MQLGEAIKSMLKTKRMSQRDLAILADISDGALSLSLKRGQMTVSTLLKYLRICGYELTIQPRQTRGMRKEDQIVID